MEHVLVRQVQQCLAVQVGDEFAVWRKSISHYSTRDCTVHVTSLAFLYTVHISTKVEVRRRVINGARNITDTHITYSMASTF